MTIKGCSAAAAAAADDDDNNNDGDICVRHLKIIKK
jgi:hypothetical protein